MDLSKINSDAYLKAFIFLAIPVIILAVVGFWLTTLSAKHVKKDVEKEKIEAERAARVKKLMDSRERELRELRKG